MESAALLKPPFILKPSQDDAVRGALTSPFPASVFQKDTTRSRFIRENYGTDQILSGGRLLDGIFIFLPQLPYIKVWECERGSDLEMKLSYGIVAGNCATPSGERVVLSSAQGIQGS